MNERAWSKRVKPRRHWSSRTPIPIRYLLFSISATSKGMDFLSIMSLLDLLLATPSPPLSLSANPPLCLPRLSSSPPLILITPMEEQVLNPDLNKILSSWSLQSPLDSQERVSFLDRSVSLNSALLLPVKDTLPPSRVETAASKIVAQYCLAYKKSSLTPRDASWTLAVPS